MNSKMQSHMCTRYLTPPRQLKKRVLSSPCANELLELGGRCTRRGTGERAAAGSQAGSVLAGCPNPTVSEWHPILWTRNVTLRQPQETWLGAQLPHPLSGTSDKHSTSFSSAAPGFLSGLRRLWLLISRCLFRIVLTLVFELRWQ